jgi:hypothetical protein
MNPVQNAMMLLQARASRGDAQAANLLRQMQAKVGARYYPQRGMRERYGVRFGGQKLTAAQTQELITMMTLAAMGIGPIVGDTYTVPAPAGDGGGGGGLDAMTQALKDKAKRAKAAADAAALAAAYAKAAKNPALLHAMMLQANTSWSRDNAPGGGGGLTTTKPQTAAPAYRGPSMSDTGVGPNVNWAPGEIQPYAAGPGISLASQDPSAQAQFYWNG